MFSQLRIITVAPLLVVLFSLTGCGQKGPLFFAPQSVPYKLLPNPPASATLAAPMPASPTSAAK